ncbi:MAG: methyltransferase, FxLD system [Ardenticatenaceae bacterium]|nr:methyltransferase, FxLD system [Ardenticatenaceae bacterium]HBY95779.1 methyltransferase, FxLD system [Chloroflexota bacterium]
MSVPARRNGSAPPALHQALVEDLKDAGHIRTPRVEAAFRAIPRHLFLPGLPVEQVYSDEAIPTKQLDGAVVSSSSQPAIMAIMLEQLELAPGHRVLEIGAGTGYNAALMAHIVGDEGQVVTVDIDDDLVAGAREHLAAAGLDRVRVVRGDGGFGYPAAAPYDRIILTVGAGDVAPAWREQLSAGGRLVLPLSLKGPQKAVAFEPVDRHLASVSVRDCGFMRLRGAFAEPSGTSIQIGPEPGLSLVSDNRLAADVAALYQSLTGPSCDWPTATWVTPREVFGGLTLWLALREPGFCRLSAVGELADRGLIPCLYWHPGEWKSCFTSGLLEGASLGLLLRPPDEAPRLDDPVELSPFQLYVRGVGPDDTLARRLITQITGWEAAGRPGSSGLRIRVYPQAIEHVPSGNEVVLQKQWSRLVLDWPALPTGTDVAP